MSKRSDQIMERALTTSSTMEESIGKALGYIKERPILFSGPMVRALLDGRKTMTRRIVKGIDECPHGYDGVVTGTVPKESHLIGKHCFQLASGESAYIRCPYGAQGDRLWVRENGWQRPERTRRMMREGADTWEPFYYDASIDAADHEQFKEWGFRRRPSVRVERLGQITEKDARAEGIMPAPWNDHEDHCVGAPKYGWSVDGSAPVSETAVRAYEDLWYSINGGWFPETWVWVVTFRRINEHP
jgi:hypothetical protein